MENHAPQKITPWGVAYLHKGRWLVAMKVKGRHRVVQESRLVYNANVGPIPLGWHIHHKNGITSDNRPENHQAMPQPEHNHYHKWKNFWGSYIDATGQRVKRCRACGRTKSVALYYSNGFTKGSKSPAYKPTCCSCQKEAAAK